MEPIFTIVYEPSEEGGFMAVIPQVQGAISQGATMEEARSMVIEAMMEIMAWRREQALSTLGPASTFEDFKAS